MKKNLLWLLIPVVLLLAWSPTMAQVQQILINGDMESWTNGPNGPPDHWNIATNHITAYREDARVHSGLHSTKVVWDSSGTLRLDYPPIPMLPSTVYTCSLWVYDYTPDVTNPRTRPWYFFSPSLPTPPPIPYSADIDGWQLLVWQDSTRYNTTAFTFQLRMYGGLLGRRDSLWIDDVVLWGQVNTENVPPSVGPVTQIPSIYNPIFPTDYVDVNALIQDPDGTVVPNSDTLYLGLNGGAYVAFPHDSVEVGNPNRFWYHIGTNPAATVVSYYVVATDNDGARGTSPTLTYTVASEVTPFVPIYSLQHTTNAGTLPNCYPTDSTGTAQTITGLVVGRYERSTAGYHSRFTVQDATTPWSAIYVYDNTAPDSVQLGDSVTVTGIVTEYYSETELGTISVFTKHLSGRTLPAPNVITCATFPADSCSATAEPYEGMIIQINNITLIDTLIRPDNGEFLGIDGSGDTCVVSNDMSSGGVDSCTFVLNHQYSYIRGIGRYTYGRYRIMPRTSADLYTSPQVCTGMNIFTVENSLDPGTGDNCWPSPYAGQYVTMCGVVTAAQQATYHSFYLQDQGNTAWGAIYGYDYTLPNGDPVNAHLGDYVQVNGFINEYYGWTELDSIQSYTVLGSGQALPGIPVLTVSAFVPGCDYSTEPFESELVRFNNVTVTSVSAQGGGKYWIRDSSSPDSIRIDDDLWLGGTDIPNPLPSVGAVYNHIIGVIRWEGRTTAPNTRGWILMPRFAADYEIGVIPEPQVVDVWPINNNSLAVTFNAAMDPISCGNPSNYSSVHGLSITGAALDPLSAYKAILTTGTQPDNMIDSLIVSNVCDATLHCMTTPKYRLYHSGITSISYLQTPNAGGDTTIWVGHIMTVKGWVTSDSSTSQPSNIYMSDQSGPPYRGLHAYVGGIPGYRPFIGDTIIATGIVAEYFSETELSNVSTYGNMQVLGSGPAPTPYQVVPSELMAHGEYYESDLVTVCDSFVVTNVALDAYGWVIHSLTTPAESLVVDKNGLWTRYTYVPVLGDRIRGITGIYKYDRSLFRISPRTNADFNSSSTWCATPTGTIAGVVYGPDGITPLNAVRVVTKDAGEVIVSDIVTNAFGVWDIPLPPGTYHEELSKTGYNNATINNIVVTSGATTNVSATMTLSTVGCHYVVGDCNNSGGFNGVDVVFAVSYFKGGAAPAYSCECTPGHTWYVAGDVNASCNFNGVDVTYAVAYFKGGQPPHPCADCPPTLDIAPAPIVPLVAPQTKTTTNAQ